MSNTTLKNFIKDPARAKEYIKDIKQLVEEGKYGLIPTQEVFTIVEGITKETEFGYYGGIENVTKKDTGCGVPSSPINANIRTGFWSPVPLLVNISECYADFEKTFLAWTNKVGVSRMDLTDSDIVAFLVHLIEQGIHADFNRFIFFGNKEHSLVGSGRGTQVLKTGLNADNFNVFDGLFAQFEKMIASNPAKRVTIAENAQTTYAGQRNLAEDRAYRVFTSLLDMADFKSGASPIILATQSLVTNLSRYMLKEFKNELTLKNIEGGYKVAEFEGVKIVTAQWLDQTIRDNFDNGTKWNNPHRAILMDKNECQIGIDSLSSLNDLDIHYIGGDTRKTYIQASYRADFQRVIGTTGAMAV